MDGIDLGGKIIFKVKLDKEIKKVIIHNDEINYNELLLMIQRIFSDRIRPNDEFRIKYADDENDLITIANDSDLAVAIQTTKILKLTIYSNTDSLSCCTFKHFFFQFLLNFSIWKRGKSRRDKG